MDISQPEKNRRILVIDDNRAIHEDFRKILSSVETTRSALDATEAALFGSATNPVLQIRFELDSAYQGQEGVILVKQALEAGRPYAMAFVDIRMPPGWDGVETTQKIWEIDPGLQIVICTAYSDYSWNEMFDRIGNRDGLVILKKPFDTVEALQLAHAFTEKWRLHQESRRKMEELERMVDERTRELQQTNRSLQLEVAERTKAEYQLSIQYAFSRVLADSTTAQGATPRILEIVCATFGWDVGALWSVDHRQDVLRCIEMWHGPKIAVDEFKRLSLETAFTPGVGLPGRVWTSGQPAWIPEVVQDGNFPRGPAAEQAGLHAAYAVPILVGNRVSGVLEFFSQKGRDPDQDLLRALAGLGSQLGQFFQTRQLEDQLFQSQKLETVGKLAGGVAHEFNSILTAIIGQSELMQGGLPAGSPLGANAAEIRRAADRAATLTRQLLAYGRRQDLHPESLDLNRVMTSVESMLRHVVGQDVEVAVVPGIGLGAVRADAGQIEQVIMNMAMNARDAMPRGGKLTLETANVTFDEGSDGRDPELKPGDYVMLAITDTGVGMSAEIQARVFEPFFSTKGVGQGTGLGLATCYGIIKQSGGHISVYSEVGRGTSFKVWLPQIPRALETRPDPLKAPGLPCGTETILLVEDDPALREMAAILLQRLGYVVLVAAHGTSALSLLEQPGQVPIDLLFTDVVMPQMDGEELSRRVLASRPGTKVLFSSAYTENALVHQGVTGPVTELLPKPYSPSALAVKVREVLDQPR